jgi:hypothetical protein
LTFLLVITIAGAALFTDANRIPFDTAKDCGQAATIAANMSAAPVEAICYASPDGKSLGEVVSKTSPRK